MHENNRVCICMKAIVFAFNSLVLTIPWKMGHVWMVTIICPCRNNACQRLSARNNDTMSDVYSGERRGCGGITFVILLAIHFDNKTRHDASNSY